MVSGCVGEDSACLWNGATRRGWRSSVRRNSQTVAMVKYEGALEWRTWCVCVCVCVCVCACEHTSSELLDRRCQLGIASAEFGDPGLDSFDVGC
jgi:hypothetical protein